MPAVGGGVVGWPGPAVGTAGMSPVFGPVGVVGVVPGFAPGVIGAPGFIATGPVGVVVVGVAAEPAPL